MPNISTGVDGVAKSINPTITTVIGGPHASSYSDKVMEHDVIDYLFRGESELSFPVFVNELSRGNKDLSCVQGLTYRNPDGRTLQKNEMQREKEHLDEIKIPDYDAMQLEQYIKSGYRFNTRHKRNAPIWVTRGCPYRCSFCMINIINRDDNDEIGVAGNYNKMRFWSPEFIINEFDKLVEMGVETIRIADEMFLLNPKYYMNLSGAQYISIIMILISIVWHYYYRKNILHGKD